MDSVMRKEIYAMNPLKVEVCCGSLQDVVTASRFPTARIELNTALELGGLTPGPGLFLKAKEVCSLPIICMVRPRTAGFNYSEREFQQMVTDAMWLLENGADGIAFGFLNEKDEIDTERTETMVNLIHGYSRTAVFHKAFDLSKDPDEAIQALIHCHVDRVLTSGLKETAVEGADVLKHLIDTYGEQISILPGGSIRAENVRELLSRTGTEEIHLSASVSMHDHGEYKAVSANSLNSLFSALHQYGTPVIQDLSMTQADLEMLVEDPYERSLEDYGDDDE